MSSLMISPSGGIVGGERRITSKAGYPKFVIRIVAEADRNASDEEDQQQGFAHGDPSQRFSVISDISQMGRWGA